MTFTTNPDPVSVSHGCARDSLLYWPLHGAGTRHTMKTKLVKRFEDQIAELERELKTELPKEIQKARELGDLRENAEYKAAKEKQDELNARVAKLKNEIERAQIFDKSTLNASKIAFGTVATLVNEATGATETYTILGPWESEPSQNVISYLSPLGKKLLNHKPGESLSFLIHERKFQYKVERIETVKL